MGKASLIRRPPPSQYCRSPICFVFNVSMIARKGIGVVDVGGVPGELRLLVEEHLEDLLRLVDVLGAGVEAEIEGGGVVKVALEVERGDLADKLRPRVEELRPAFLEMAALDLRRIVDEAGGAPHVGRGVLALGVVSGASKGGLTFLKFGMLGVSISSEQAFVDHDLGHEVGRHDDVVAAAAALTSSRSASLVS